MNAREESQLDSKTVLPGEERVKYEEWESMFFTRNLMNNPNYYLFKCF